MIQAIAMKFGRMTLFTLEPTLNNNGEWKFEFSEIPDGVEPLFTKI